MNPLIEMNLLNLLRKAEKALDLGIKYLEKKVENQEKS